MKLYLVHVGFYEEAIGIYELHSNMFVVAENAKKAKELVKQKETFIRKKMHIDGIEELTQVDGYDIKLEKSTDETFANQKFDYDAAKAL